MTDIEKKRLDTLARNRASAELKRRHQEEWEEIRARLHANLLAERLLIGEVTRSRHAPLHVAGEDGMCEQCGAKSPCDTERKRLRERRARETQPVPVEESP